MAVVYLSYKSGDRELAGALAQHLEKAGHKVKFDQGLHIGAPWREQLLAELLASDVVIVLWTELTFQSQFVAAEVGAVRASPRIGLLPIVVGEVNIPAFIKDLNVERLRDPGPENLPGLAQKLDHSIARHIEYRDRHKVGMPKIFVSHRHKDEEIVRALLECVKTNFVVEREDIRCTSVAPYRLRAGENTSDRLRTEIANAEVVLGILTTDTLESVYVAFELGSAWGQRVWTCPLLAKGATQGHIPDPIRDLAPLLLSKSRDCFQLIGDLERGTSLVKRGNVDGSELDEKVRRLSELAGRSTD